ncbi:Txe/YoeB family addiction module toxin [Porphyromonas somerae]|uniref:Txe/YoeB family addiction module toxin n=1 Tax=Porphyromonas somerae TaxID=322095 RepID=UPI001FCBE54B|nr:Txe/YoeB family addiction module toxin [Porphyromonas somerae]BDE80988.1 hypothetical protein CE91St14_00160 [Porphyromonas somerae]
MQAKKAEHSKWNGGLFKKIESLLSELEEHPTTGTGKPEQLKGVEGIWSRRIDKKNRLLYTIKEDKILVLVLSAMGHYYDK